MTAADTDIKEVEKMFAVNVFGPMRMVRYFHPFLVVAKGVVVNIGSIGGIVPYVYGGKQEKNHFGGGDSNGTQQATMPARPRYTITETLCGLK
jgi:NAD(P)-dependent dehydrogenase (short-subunit alcohol dehydrogenase family)